MKLKNIIFHGVINNETKKEESKFINAVNFLSTQDLPIKKSYSLVKLLKQLKEKLEVFNEAKMNLYKKYGEEDKKTQQIIVKQENMASFNKEYTELCEQEEEYNFSKIDILPEDNIKIKADYLVELEDIINIK